MDVGLTSASLDCLLGCGLSGNDRFNSVEDTHTKAVFKKSFMTSSFVPATISSKGSGPG